MKTSVVIPAAGTGNRMNSEIPKQFIEINGIPTIIRTIKLFDNIKNIESIVIVSHCDWVSYIKELIKKFNCNKVKEIIIGGKERQDSVFIGLQTISVADTELVLIHDSVRPFASENLIYKLIKTAKDFGSAIPIIKPTDSIKQIDNKGNIEKTLDRNYIGLVQTPEVFRTSIIIDSYKNANKLNYKGTDTSSLVEFMGYNVRYLEGEIINIKITTPLDLELASIIFK